MIPKLVHQIYGIFDDGVPLEDIKEYKDAVNQTELYCLTNNIEYKMWSKKDCEELLVNKYSEYIDLYNEFRYDIQRADFIRYIILFEFGGIYIDCDVIFIQNFMPYDIFDREYFFVKSYLGIIYNAIMGSNKNNNIFKLILNEIEMSIYKQEKDIYKTWKGRLVFQTTGQYMLKRVLKNDKNILTNLIETKQYGKNIDYKQISTFFLDYNASVWYINIMKT
tara:strand:- start:2800 stop:3462 length:663 start_codon:yes stop_codon:yes gene_type:complete